MSYQVLAQKYRPQTFEEVVGQEAVTRTLKNSILKQRTANAYIFCGPRGVGKTSVARLLAKALNCSEPPEKSPCNKCVSCAEITRSSNIDVLEIDGASNNSVDEIRTLRENVKFSPSKSRFKVYIIDEVHMLSTGAFNALLKTLEEPPGHVKFVFATTEPHKVLPTIMSRCQRFDFRRIPPVMIYKKLLDTAGREDIEIEEKAALLIARYADGSLRDALVILDQMVSFSGRKIDASDVAELLGIVHKDRIFELAGSIIGGDAASSAVCLDKMVAAGKDPVLIAGGLIQHFRDLMILKTSGSQTSDMIFSSDELNMMRSQLEKVSLQEILYILQHLSNCLTLMKGVNFTRSPLEITLIKLARRGEMLSLAEILKKVDGGRSETGRTSEKKIHERQNRESSSEEGPSENGGVDAGSAPNGEFDNIMVQWRAVLNYIRGRKMSVFTFLDPAKPVEFGRDKVVIGFSKSYAFNKEALEANGNKSVVEEAVNKVTGANPSLEFTLLEFLGESQEKETPPSAKKSKMGKEMKMIVEKAMDIFGGHVVRDFIEEHR